MSGPRASRACVAAVVLVLAGCGGDRPDDAGTTLDAAAVCPGGTTVDDVVTCTRLHEDGVALVLPDDAGGSRYGAVARSGEGLLTRGGLLPLAPAVVEELFPGGGPPQDPGDGSAPSSAADLVPYAQSVYRAAVEDGTVVRLTPAVRVDESALLTRVLGGRVLEGAITPLVSEEDGYEVDPTLPVRLELQAAAEDGVLRGTLVNATAAVRLSSGQCAPALTDAGAADPLRVEPFTERVALQRVPSMHGPFNDELLLVWGEDVSNMGPEYYPSAAALLDLEPLTGTWQTSLHGNPTAGPGVVLELVEGGGGACA